MDTMNKVTNEVSEHDYCCRKHHEMMYPHILSFLNGFCADLTVHEIRVLARLSAHWVNTSTWGVKMDTMNKVINEASEHDYCCRKHHVTIVSTHPVIFERVLCRSDGSLNSGCGRASTITVSTGRGVHRGGVEG